MRKMASKSCAAVYLYLFFLGLIFNAVSAVASTPISASTTQHPTTPPPSDHVKNVHVIFMNHLDVGYDGVAPTIGFINNVINKYFMEYFPRSIMLSESLRDGGYVENFIYTTHPWLVALYLQCPQNFSLAGVQLKCPNATHVAAFQKAVVKGDITWHAGPMNMQMENMADWLFEFGINISSALDTYFDIKRQHRVVSQRDVPGMTQAVIPSLVRLGVSAVSVGVNPTTSPPAVPNPFIWRYGNDEVIGTWHKGGYPLNPGPDPAHPGGASVKDCTIIPGFSDALCFAFRTDNSGPPINIEEVINYYEIFRAEFPNAKIRASTFDNYITALWPIKNQLPVVTKEIGDTWILGIASDPRKMAEYRSVSRILGKCIKQGQCQLDDRRIVNAAFLLTKLPEHTWGLPSVDDTVNWTNQKFYQASSGSNFKNCSRSWAEQRQMTYFAVEALGSHSVVSDIVDEIKQIQPKLPTLDDYIQILPGSQLFTCQTGMQIGFSMDGSITTLTHNNVNLASPLNPLGKFTYYSYNESDFDMFNAAYSYGGNAGFRKANVTRNAYPESRGWRTTIRDMFYHRDNKCNILLHLEVIDSKSWTYYGAPRELWVKYEDRNNTPPGQPVTSMGGLDITLQYFDKTSTRLPEALMFGFNPVLSPDHNWYMSKIGQLVNPYNVIQNGSQYQHGIDDNGIYYINSKGAGLQFRSLDVPLVCPVTSVREASPFAAPLQPITANITGMAFNLYNNVWDTNYILWYPYSQGDQDFKARFSIDFLNSFQLELQQKMKRLQT